MTVSAGHGRLLWLLGALYFAQGLPFGLLVRSLPAIARDAGLSPELIGLLALPAAPWALKFLWAPFVDQYGRGRPGHRRRWIIACQLAAMGLLAVVALQPPEQLLLRAEQAREAQAQQASQSSHDAQKLKELGGCAPRSRRSARSD